MIGSKEDTQQKDGIYELIEEIFEELNIPDGRLKEKFVEITLAEDAKRW